MATLLTLVTIFTVFQAGTGEQLTFPRLESHARDLVVPNFTQELCEVTLPQLICNISPTEGYSTTGFVHFIPTWSQVTNQSDPSSGEVDFTCYTRINATISQLEPNSAFGFHMHTYGDLSSTDGNSTGGHYAYPLNPAGTDVSHGYPDDAVRHWGDFGNLTSNAQGVAVYNRVDDVINLGVAVGRSITIHAGRDKGSRFQPTGDSGARIGYCVIGYKNPDTILYDV